MNKFYTVTRFNDDQDLLPIRKTAQSAGYDFFVAEDTIIPSFWELREDIAIELLNNGQDNGMTDENDNIIQSFLSLEDAAKVIKEAKAKFTLVSTGVKAQLDPDCYLELSVRSSCPLKHHLIMANSVGIIDADYYNNPDNEGEIFFQMINLSPFPIQLKKGDCIGQGIIHKYCLVEDDAATGARTGGFGSTDA